MLQPAPLQRALRTFQPIIYLMLHLDLIDMISNHFMVIVPVICAFVVGLFSFFMCGYRERQEVVDEIQLPRVPLHRRARSLSTPPVQGNHSQGRHNPQDSAKRKLDDKQPLRRSTSEPVDKKRPQRSPSSRAKISPIKRIKQAAGRVRTRRKAEKASTPPVVTFKGKFGLDKEAERRMIRCLLRAVDIVYVAQQASCDRIYGDLVQLNGSLAVQHHRVIDELHRLGIGREVAGGGYLDFVRCLALIVARLQHNQRIRPYLTQANTYRQVVIRRRIRDIVNHVDGEQQASHFKALAAWDKVSEQFKDSGIEHQDKQVRRLFRQPTGQPVSHVLKLFIWRATQYADDSLRQKSNQKSHLPRI